MRAAPIPQTVINPRGGLHRSLKRPFVHRIPAETLTEIFLLVRDGSTVSSACTGSSHDLVCAGNFALLRVTATCLRWRLVAANSSLLWNKIAFSTRKAASVQCAELFLGRTKDCVLCVYISAPILPDTPAMWAPMHRLFLKISSQSHRVRVFEFFATPKTSIIYVYWTNPRINQQWTPGIDSAIPSACSAFPLVESMKLSSPSWCPSIAPCLKYLDLRSNGGDGSLSSLLHALEGCPVLEFLTLQGYRQFDDENSSYAPVTTLPKLHRLQIFFCNSAFILAFLHLPSLTHPLVIFDSDPHEGLLRCLPQGQPGAPYLEGVSELHVVLNMGNSQYSVTAYREDGRTSLYLGVTTVSHPFRREWIRGSMEAIASFAPFSKATSISIATDATFTLCSTWLSKMRHLSRLDLRCPDIMGYLDTLSSPVNGSPLCPSLRILALRRFRPSKNLDYGLVKACILFRRAAGCPLTSVIVPEDEWTRVRAHDASWDILVDSQGK